MAYTWETQDYWKSYLLAIALESSPDMEVAMERYRRWCADRGLGEDDTGAVEAPDSAREL